MKSLIIFLLFISVSLQAQLNVTNFPSDYQLIPRNENNIGLIPISGNYVNAASDSVRLNLYRNDTLINSISQSKQNFNFNVSLFAELSEYKLTFSAKINENWELIRTADKILCGDVILLYGQSNMNAFSGVDYFNNNYSDKFLRSFSYLYFESEQLLWFPGKQPYAEVGSIGNHLMLNIIEHSKIPICIINEANGGASVLNLTAENPENRMDKSYPYGRLLSKLYFGGLINHVKMMVYFQGEAEANNSNENCLEYPNNWTILYNKLKQDLPNLKKVYEIQINIMTNQYIVEKAGFLRDFQRNTKTLFPDDIEIYSAIGQRSYDGIHYGYESYINLANGVWNLINRDFYGGRNNQEIEPPNIQYAYYKPTRDTLVLQFQSDQNMQLGPFDYSFNNSFYLSETISNSIYDPHLCPTVKTIAIANEIFLIFNSPQNARYITYLLSTKNNNEIFFGPYLKNGNNHSAFSFYKFPVNIYPLPEPISISSPNTFRVNAISDHQIRLTWSDNNMQNNYTTEIWKSTNNTTFTKINNIDPNQLYFTDSGLKPESNSFYKIRFCNNFECSNFSPISSDITFKKRPFNCKNESLTGDITSFEGNFQSKSFASVQKINNSKINYLFENHILLQPGFECNSNFGSFFITEQRQCE